MTDLTKIAKKLHAHGWSVLPLRNTKFPVDKGWQGMRDDDRVVPNGQFTHNINAVGVLGGAKVDGYYTAAIDVDCYDRAISRAMCDFIAEFADGGVMPYRAGQRPKFLVPVLVEQQSRKLLSQSFDDGEHTHRLELLCDGQQWAMFGEHPKAKNGEYAWFNGEAFDPALLPRLTMEQVHQVIAQFDTLMVDKGYRPVKPKSDVPTLSDDPFNGVLKSNASLAEAKRLLSHIDPDCGYEEWWRVGGALHNEFNGSRGALDLWDEWSQGGDKYAKNEGVNNLKTKWASFGRDDGAPVIGFGTLCDLAEKGGADLSAIAHEFIDTDADEGNGGEVTKVDDDLSPKGDLSQVKCACNSSVTALGLTWQVEGMIEKGSISQMFAPSFSGKSYVALHLAACLASGAKFGDKRTVPTRVLYLYGEGEHGIQRRIEAIKAQYPDLAMDRLFYSAKLPNLLSVDGMRDFYRMLKGLDGVGLVIYDTLARSMPGADENSTKDFSKVHGVLARLRDLLGCSALVVHHTGHGNQDRARGSSANYAAMDNEIKVEKLDDGVLRVSSTKAKDAPQYAPLHFKFVPVEFDVQDNFGNQITSAAVEFVADYEEATDKKRPLSPSGLGVFDAFKEVADDPKNHCVTPPEFAQKMGLDAPPFGIAGVTVRSHWERMQRNTEPDHVNLRVKWSRGLQDAVSKGYLASLDEIIVSL